MNQFLIIVRGSHASAGSPDQVQGRRAAFNEWVAKVLDGRFVGGAPLEDDGARLLTAKGEFVTDGPFVESKEMISGYMIIKAKDIDEATRLTNECPLLKDFRLELRTLMPME